MKIIYGWEKTCLVLSDKEIEDIIEGKTVFEESDSRLLFCVRREIEIDKKNKEKNS